MAVSADVGGVLQWRGWMDQPAASSPVMRGGLTAWPEGAQGLVGDVLGPVMHVHDGASEIFLIAQGRCNLEVGDQQHLLEPGDFVLVPPEVPHNVLNAGPGDLLLLWAVAPNFVDNRWRTEGFSLEVAPGTLLRGRTAGSGSLPSDQYLTSDRLELPPGANLQVAAAPRGEGFLYVTAGEGEMVSGGRVEQLRCGTLLHLDPDLAGGSLKAGPEGLSVTRVLAG